MLSLNLIVKFEWLFSAVILLVNFIFAGPFPFTHGSWQVTVSQRVEGSPAVIVSAAYGYRSGMRRR